MEPLNDSSSYKDSVSTISEQGKRIWVYPKKPKGRFTSARTVVAIILILILVVTPFIKVHDHPVMLFNLLARKFIFFGLAFGPYDFAILVVGFIAFAIFIILFTAIFGRIFCGWICPQTIFMEIVFRKIEYWIEGDFRKQIALDKSDWTFRKYQKKILKHIIFFFLSFLVANVLLAWVIGVEELYQIITDPPAQHLSGFIAITLFSGLFYFIFSRFREQACTVVCPYGRLQGVLLDKNSLVVAYDNVRGEPRGKIKKKEERTAGDCIDCKLCLDVCPTGIDIRNGIQLECVNCTACIDACDEVMDKVKKPRGLIRYDSLQGIKDRIRFKITPRIISYSVILLLLISLFSYLLATRDDIEVNILRAPGMLYQDQPNEKISNLYNFNIVNKTFEPIAVSLKIKNIDAEIKLLGANLNLDPLKVEEGKFMIVADKKVFSKLNTPIFIGVYRNGKEITSFKTSFLSNIILK
ncbi:MAG: cytochrome c oxidase accessory protein CcoG [Ignavibacteriaceae bacterium]|jgi:cytochrome c oxidase accessory protein FixG|nr:cytochrome c oxidase accessory protein CcoG [Ignavibacteriaceae bacterium]